MLTVIRNTTATIAFEAYFAGESYDLSNASAIEISIKQMLNDTVVKKTGNDVLIDGNIAIAMFSPADTLLFDPDYGYAQIRVKASDGTVLGDVQQTIRIADVNSEVAL